MGNITDVLYQIRDSERDIRHFAEIPENINDQIENEIHDITMCSTLVLEDSAKGIDIESDEYETLLLQVERIEGLRESIFSTRLHKLLKLAETPEYVSEKEKEGLVQKERECLEAIMGIVMEYRRWCGIENPVEYR